MVYDTVLVDRIRLAIKRRKGFVEKKMFGGVGFLLNGNMCVGAWREFLIVRVGLDAYEFLLSEPFTQEFNITGKVMRGWLMIEPEGVSQDDELRRWIEFAIEFVRTLPAK